jgi:hypothetical protein
MNRIIAYLGRRRQSEIERDSIKSLWRSDQAESSHFAKGDLSQRAKEFTQTAMIKWRSRTIALCQQETSNSNETYGRCCVDEVMEGNVVLSNKKLNTKLPFHVNDCRTPKSVYTIGFSRFSHRSVRIFDGSCDTNMKMINSCSKFSPVTRKLWASFWNRKQQTVNEILSLWFARTKVHQTVSSAGNHAQIVMGSQCCVEFVIRVCWRQN